MLPEPVPVGENAAFGTTILLMVLSLTVIAIYLAVRRYDLAGRQLTSFDTTRSKPRIRSSIEAA